VLREILGAQSRLLTISPDATAAEVDQIELFDNSLLTIEISNSFKRSRIINYHPEYVSVDFVGWLSS